MNIFETYEHLIRVELERMVSAGDLPPADFSRLSVDPPREAAHGELATNAALIAGQADLAPALAQHFVSLHDVTNATAADNGLVNLTLKPIVWHRAISGILHSAEKRDPCHGIVYDAAKDFSLSDPVFGIQYARTICCAVIRHAQTALAQDVSDNELATAPLARLETDKERILIRKLAGWQHALRGGSRPRDVYMAELVGLFRELAADQTGDAAMGFVDLSDTQLSLARLALVRATAIVLAQVSL